MHYRDMPHRNPKPEAELPAFVVSEYGDGDFYPILMGALAFGVCITQSNWRKTT